MKRKHHIYELLHRIFVHIGVWFGFRCYNMNLSWFNDAEYLRVWKMFPQSHNVIHERRFNLYSLAKSIRNIAGDMAECGVYQGASSHLMLEATAGTSKQIHLFDSFEGLSTPGEKDIPKNNRSFHWKKHDLSASEALVRDNLQQFSARAQYYAGWIPTRFSEVEDNRFSLVHIDVDLYQPTFDSIAFFYSKMSPGGLIICDDYGFETCPGARQAMDDFMQDKPESIVHLTTGQGIVIKQ